MMELAVGMVGLLGLLSVIGMSILFVLAIAVAIEKFCENMDEDKK